MPSPSTTRRAFLRHAGSTVLAATGVGAVLAGCSGDDEGSTDNVSVAPTASDPSADETAAARALRDTVRLAATYDAVLARHQRLRPTLRGPRADLQEHLDVLSGTLGDGTTASGKPLSLPGSPNAALRQLASDENAMLRRRRRDAIRAESGELARLLASIAASHAQHVELLGGRAKEWRSEPPDPDRATIENEAVVEAMNTTLSGEHAAIYAYGVIGGRLDIDSQPVSEATDAIEAHRPRRDGLTALIEAGDSEPVAAEPGYLLPTEVVDVADARTTAQKVEDRSGVLYATLAATADGPIRAFAVDALVDSAIRGLAWGAPGSALPGLAGSRS